MDIRTRLTRKPVTTALWLVLVTAMALFLSVGVALWYSTGNLFDILDEYHSAVAYRLDRGVQYVAGTDGDGHFNVTDRTMSEEQVTALEEMDSVKTVHFHSLSGGYSPSFEPVLGVKNGLIHCFEWYHQSVESYKEVMIVGTVRKLHWVADYGYRDMWPIYDGEFYRASAYYLVDVEEIVLAHESYNIETAMADTADTMQMNVSMSFVGEDALAYIQEGERYVFFGNYSPDTGFHVNSAAPMPDERYNLVQMSCNSSILSDGVLQAYEGNWSVLYGNEGVLQTAAKLDGTLEEFLADPANIRWAEQVENWNLKQHSVPVLGTPALDTFYVFMKNQASMVEGRMFTQEEYDAGAKVCILSSSLAQRSGLTIGDTIRLSQFPCINENESVNVYMNDGFLNNPTIGCPIQMPEFVTEDEEFTIVGLYSLRDEWADTSYSITPNTVFIPKKAQIEDTFGGADCERELVVARETDQDGKITREIVKEKNLVENGSFGVYLSIELVNGRMEDFLREINEDPLLKGQFHTVDQGLENAIKSIEALAASADKLMLLVGLGWVLLLILYVLLYQGGQRQNLGIMRSLGASPKIARDYLFGSGMALASIGVVLGGILSGVIFRIVQSKIAESTLAQVDKSAYSAGAALTEDALVEMVSMSQISAPMLLALCAAQLAVIAVALWLHAGSMAKRKPRNLLGV